MHPGLNSAGPGAPASITAADGAVVTFEELEAASNRLAQLLRARGLGTGSHVAVMLENSPRFIEVMNAAWRAGIHLTPINWHLGAEEAGYIVEDCDATALITSARFADTIEAMAPHLGRVTLRLSIGGGPGGFEDLDAAVASMASTPIADEARGSWMFYSSGTTGRPKGIYKDLDGADPSELIGFDLMLQHLYGVTSDSVLLCPAPYYHAAPAGWVTSFQRCGGTVVVMDKFDAEAVLAAIDAHKVTHIMCVPTHFIRLLKLPDEVRARYDVSSLRTVVHAAAPCPVEVKRSMFDWFGPIIHEYYAGSEGNAFFMIGPEEWLAHPGSVGKNIQGTVHILDEDGMELPVGEAGQIWFEGGAEFEYHKDPEKTKESFNAHGWSTLGDVGYLDDEGYLYLTDRVSHMIISGGVNIYPQEIENVLIGHPAVGDVAVIGIPDAEMGESVLAVVGAELLEFARAQLAGFKCPRRVDFTDELPRLPTGKLLKRKLRDAYA